MLSKKQQRLRRSRQTRIRIATQGVARLMVNRTNLHIYASVISGDGTKVIATASTAEADVRKSLAAVGKGGTKLQLKSSASVLPKKPKLRVWRKSLSIVQALPTTVASKHWQMPRALPACSSNSHGYTTWQKFKQKCKTTVVTTV